MPGGKVLVNLGAGYVLIVTVQMSKFFYVRSLHKEIHFLLGYEPHLIQHLAKVHHFLGTADDLHQGGCSFEQHDVLTHNLIDARTLDLDGHLFSTHQSSAMNLSNAGRPQGIFVDIAEDLLPTAVVLLLYDLGNGFKGQGQSLCLELHKLLAVVRWQEIRTHAHDLTQLYKGRAQILQYRPEFLRGHAPHDLPLAQDIHHFLEARRSTGIFHTPLEKSLEHCHASGS